MPGSLRLWTRKEAAEALNLSQRTLLRMIQRGELKTGLFGRIPNDEVLRLAGKVVVQ